MFENLIGTLKWFDITYATVRPFDQNNLACNICDDIKNFSTLMSNFIPNLERNILMDSWIRMYVVYP